ncbi:MAG TPA: transglycosylase SLT domain-containing protein [Pyrinomonadaceae bacterium]|nr:transglycosylase SLT domain-containing protein [Pyrinomonadaceae bacterium]
MVEVKLTIYSGAESREFQMTGDQVSLGRGEVTLKLSDAGLSRLHATIYRDGDRVWILDEGSTNGTSVNGAPVPAAGLPLKDGDEIAMGDDTAIAIRIFKLRSEQPATRADSWWATNHALTKFWPVVTGVAAVLVVVIAIVALSNAGGASDEETNLPPIIQRPTASATIPSNATVSSDANRRPSNSLSSPGISPEPNVETIPPEAVKTYLQMSEPERRSFIQREAEQVARVIGNRSGEAVTPDAIDTIKSFVDAYASRVRRPKLNAECYAGNWLKFDLTSILERGQKNAPFIIRAFNEKGLDPQLGLYLAMIESEYCDCLQSPTGPLGMFQFAARTAQNFGVKAVRGSTPSNPDERCEPEPAARGAAAFMKFLIGRYGTGPLSVPLAIASYNSGEGALSSNLSAAMTNAMQEERSFWTLVANKGRLSDQFQRENIKYVPKFFGAAIVGENPQVFGVPLQRLSSYDH